MKQTNNLDTWLDKIELISGQILLKVEQGEIPEQTDLDNRQRLIDIAGKNCTEIATPEQRCRINAILDQDEEIIRQLEELSVKIRTEIGNAFKNRTAISKFKLNEL